jgi:Baseplate J-like protein
MPLKIPALDERSYQQLVDESLARIPAHTPGWTNFNASDPGVTLIQLFSFLTESLLYRANLIPERNRIKFLQLLGITLQPAASARGIVTFANERGPMETITLDRDVEVRAGAISFRTENGIDVQPVEPYVCFKRKLADQPEEEKLYYRQLYASFLGDDTTADPQADVELYELVPLGARGASSVNVTVETVDNALWIALLARPNADLDEVRKEIAGKTLSLGLVPRLESEEAQRRLAAVGTESEAAKTVGVELPSVPSDGKLAAGTAPSYKTIANFTMPIEPAVIEVPLPDASQLGLWRDIDPLELGADRFPPTLEETALNARVVTWIRMNFPDGVASKVAWAGINASLVRQRARVANELLPEGTGEPDQAAVLSHAPVIPGSVKLMVAPPNESPMEWKLIDDLLAAGAEVPAPDLREPPARIAPPPRPSKVFALDPEAGRIRFGDGVRGARPPAGAVLRVTYDYGVGRAGNIGENTINQAPALPAGIKVANPVRTWGGSDAETVTEAEKQISRYLQHRDRLVTADDFETITRRAPGVDLGRVDVLPAYNPTLARQEPGNAPGAVTLMLVPKYSSTRPDAPSPDPAFLSSVCSWLNPRRLVTTELYLRGPNYVPLWISAAIEIVPTGADPDVPNSAAVVREAVKRHVRDFLAPVRPDGKGWPLRRSVSQLELMAEISRVEGVLLVNKLILAASNGSETTSVAMKGLELPRIDGIEVMVGSEPLPIDQLRGTAAAGPIAPGRKIVPVPVIPAEC